MLAYVAAPDAPHGVARREAPMPQPRAGEVLVRVAAFSLNRGEIGHVGGLAPGTVMGWDLAGVVDRPAAGGGGPEAGQRVFGWSLARGSWAEYAAVPAATLAVLPDGVSMEAGSCLGVASLTALYALRRGGSVLGRRVLVTGAAGGVGRVAVQLAALSGAEVEAVVGPDPSRADAIRSLGLPGVTIVAALTALGAPAHLILESVGGESLSAAFQRVAPGGLIVYYGRSSAREGSVPTGFFSTGAQLQGLSFARDMEGDQIRPAGLETLAALVDQGRLDPGISLCDDWSELDAAIDALMGRSVAGKAVLRVGQG
jgi:NADPH:quinone reductase-like Zn-dependent oxidoreductase